MSASVWFEDIDTALLVEIQKSVKISGNKSLPEESVFVRKPDEDYKGKEYKIDRFPSVTIYNLTSDFAVKRHIEDAKINKVIDEEKAEMSFNYRPKPFNLRYQIDLWSNLQTDMNAMVGSWLVNHTRQWNLPLLNENGEVDDSYTCNVLQEGNVNKLDLMTGDLRIFHSIIIYTIWVDLFDETIYTKNIAVEPGDFTVNGT